MFIGDVPQLAMPDLPARERDSLAAWGHKALAASAKQGGVVIPDNLWDEQQKSSFINEELTEATTAIDKIIRDFAQS